MTPNQAEHRRIRAQNRLKHARDVGDGGRLGAEFRSYFRNVSVKVDSAYREFGRNIEPTLAVEYANLVNLFEVDRSEITMWRIPKRSKGFRTITALTQISRMRQRIIKEAISCGFSLESHLYLAKGRGRDREALAIQAAGGEGFIFGYQADIENAFASARVISFLCNTPLPQSVILANLYYAQRHYEPDYRKEVLQGYDSHDWYHDRTQSMEGHKGLIQGAASSSHIFALLFNDMADSISPNVRLFVFGDDVLLLAKDQSECAAAAQSLGRYMLAHPAGPFHLIGSEVNFRTGFDRLGYRFKRDWRSGDVEIGLCRAAWMDRLSKLAGLADMNLRLGAHPCSGGRVALRNFGRGYPALTNLDEVRADLLFCMGESAVERRREQGIPQR
ncbi:reverse transcriptase domain-containing protein [Boseaceae bacterium BT-24-1]|nr:reverse transcriptase domain-containing protein [Boseaceae bacterium BT-24-1]